MKRTTVTMDEEKIEQDEIFTITVAQDSVKQRDEIVRCNFDSIQKAMSKLNKHELKLYLYYMAHEGGFLFNTEDITKKLECSIECVENSIDGLINKGYLVDVDDDNCIFYEDPDDRNDVERGM